MSPIPLRVHRDYVCIKTEPTRFDDIFYTNSTIDFGFGDLPLPDNFTIKEKLIESKTKEMTLDEIEKKLGHKVKIINKED